MALELKLAAIGVAVAAVGIGLSVTDDREFRRVVATTSYPPGCAVAIEGAPGYLPRAGVTIENRSGGAVRAWLEARNGLARVELGEIGAGEVRVVAHALPAGRNLLHAGSERRERTVHAALAVANHGAATSPRRHLWRID